MSTSNPPGSLHAKHGSFVSLPPPFEESAILEGSNALSASMPSPFASGIDIVEGIIKAFAASARPAATPTCLRDSMVDGKGVDEGRSVWGGMRPERDKR